MSLITCKQAFRNCFPISTTSPVHQHRTPLNNAWRRFEMLWLYVRRTWAPPYGRNIPTISCCFPFKVTRIQAKWEGMWTISSTQEDIKSSFQELFSQSKADGVS